MYLSRVYIQNYRSIKQLDLILKKGKNVIVGKNNSGKSNIIKAIDLVLGEKSPIWSKSNNISDNDFFEGNTNEEILIWCELTKEPIETLDFSTFNGTFFNLVDKKSRKIVKIDFDPFHNETDTECFLYYFSEEFNEAIDRSYSKRWVGAKKYCEISCEAELRHCTKLAFVFRCKATEDENIVKEMIFLYKKEYEPEWYIAINTTLRSHILQSAIIPSFRDPKDQLRITDYTWYGKLLKEYIPASDSQLEKAFEEVKNASNNVFKQLCDKISNVNTQIAFPNTTISFQFNPDTKQDVYKSTLIYVDDGFNTKLEDKGAGIQSSVIISLFDFYVRHIAHSNGSLLAIEEPELYLHPHGRRVISDRLDTFLDENKNQVIITTHSPEFICSPDDSINLIVVKKDGNKSIAQNFYFSDLKSKQILIKKQNSEMFFADAVILVEGADKYLLESIAKEFGEKNRSDHCNITKNWLNDYNVSIISCGGKHELWKYANVLKSLKIPYLTITDFDFFRDGLDSYLDKMGMNKEKAQLSKLKSRVISTKSSHSEINGIAGICDKIKEDINSKQFDIADRSTREIQRIIKKNKGTYKKLEDIENASIKTEIENYIMMLRHENIFLLSGELEDFYTVDTKSSKEQAVLEIINMCENKKISDFVKTCEFEDALTVFVEHCLGINIIKN